MEDDIGSHVAPVRGFDGFPVFVAEDRLHLIIDVFAEPVGAEQVVEDVLAQSPCTLG